MSPGAINETCRRKYSLREDKAMVTFLAKKCRTKFVSILGLRIWQLAAAAKITPHSPQSMQSHFRKILLLNIRMNTLSWLDADDRIAIIGTDPSIKDETSGVSTSESGSDDDELSIKAESVKSEVSDDDDVIPSSNNGISSYIRTPNKSNRSLRNSIKSQADDYELSKDEMIKIKSCIFELLNSNTIEPEEMNIYLEQAVYIKKLSLCFEEPVTRIQIMFDELCDLELVEERLIRLKSSREQLVVDLSD